MQSSNHTGEALRMLVGDDAAPRGDRAPAAGPLSGRAEIEAWMKAELARHLSVPADEIDSGEPLLSYGLDSVAAVRLAFLAEERLGMPVSPFALYEHPTLRELAGHLASQLPAGAPPPEILAPAPTLPPPADEEPFALTLLQQAYVWARGARGHLLGRSCHVYMETDVDEPLDRGRLQAGFERLVERHAMLRAVFREDGRQEILPRAPAYTLRVEDLSALPASERDASALRIREELGHQDFDPAVWPLFDVRAARTGSGSFRLFLSMDMLLVDFQSLAILLSEWRRLYESPDRPLPPVSIEFRSYLDRLEAHRRTPRYERDRAWWTERLDTMPEPPRIRLAADPAKLTAPRFGSKDAEVDRATWVRIRDAARDHGVTPSAAMGAAYAGVIAAWSGSRRFVLNLPIFDRVGFHEDVDRLVGPFTTNVLVPVDLTPGEDPWQTAKSLHRSFLEALEHRLFHGVEVARALGQKRRAGLASLAPVVLTSALYGSRLEGWGRIRTCMTQTPQVWLDCQAFEDGEGLRLRWDHVEDLLPSEAIEPVFRDFVRRIVDLARPAAPAEPARARGPTLHGLVAETARRSPWLRAVVAPEGELTYRDLDLAANRVAHALSSMGARPGERVAISVGRGLDQAVAALAVVRSGAAYVPVDPGLPAARSEFLLSDSGASIVLADRASGPRHRATGARVLEMGGSEIAAASAEPFPERATDDDLAYVLYTSGSTGRPKGVMIPHRGAVATIEAVNRLWKVGPFDRVLGFSSLSFDLSVWDLFGSFAAGATLVTLPESDLRDPQRWLARIEEEGVTIWNSVPSAMKMLLDFCEGRTAPSARTLRLVLLSGDWIPLSLPDRIRGFFRGARPVSLGGATEGSIWSCFHEIGEVRPEWRSIPYGRGLPGQSLHVLDESLAPVAPGTEGEIAIGGAGVALGYWNDPERTARSFVRDPATGAPLYRTGDRGRVAEDGLVEFLGRVDQQVKIRGFRVEIAEVENALAAHPAIDSCAVVARGQREERFLAAFYVPRSRVSPQELREHVRAVVPEYMVPDRLVDLPALPLNANGKVDRGALHERAI